MLEKIPFHNVTIKAVYNVRIKAAHNTRVYDDFLLLPF